MVDSMILVQKKCKCGHYILCKAGDGTKDGNLIEHEDCSLNPTNKNKEEI